jgi:hypothetical protein
MRKQCSETLPACVSCGKFGLVLVYPGSPATLPTPPTGSEQSESPVRARHSVANGRNTPSAMQGLNDCVRLPSIHLPGQIAVLESTHFFNTRLLPEVAPAHTPFQRIHIAAAEWLAAPRVMQTSLAIITLSMQQSRSSNMPSTNRTFLHCRGICLTELMTLVTDANVESQTLAFDCIQLVMLAEIQLDPTGSWAYHLEAAGRGTMRSLLGALSCAVRVRTSS